jgi:hypothetical protein
VPKTPKLSEETVSETGVGVEENLADSPSVTTPRATQQRRPSVFWPLVLVGGGVLLLLSNLGYLPWQSWNVLWRLWPLLLVALGVDLLIGKRSLAGALVSALVIAVLLGGAISVALLGQRFPTLTAWVQTEEWVTEHVEYPSEGVDHAAVSIDWPSLPSYLGALEDSAALIEADVSYRGKLVFDVGVRRNRAEVRLDSRSSVPWFGPRTLDDKQWDVGLSPQVSLDLVLDAGSGPGQFDLTGLRVTDLSLDAGSGPIELVLPSGCTFEGRIDAGSGPVEIVLPAGIGGRVELDSGSGPFSPDERFTLISGSHRGDGVWETASIDDAHDRIVLSVDQGSGPITIH